MNLTGIPTTYRQTTDIDGCPTDLPSYRRGHIYMAAGVSVCRDGNNQEPEAPADLEALLADPNLMPSEREALQHLLAVTVASEAQEMREANDCTLDHNQLDAGRGTPPPQGIY